MEQEHIAAPGFASACAPIGQEAGIFDFCLPTKPKSRADPIEPAALVEFIEFIEQCP